MFYNLTLYISVFEKTPTKSLAVHPEQDCLHQTIPALVLKGCGMAAGLFVGQGDISLIPELAASSESEDPGCSRTHAAPLLREGWHTFPARERVCGGFRASRWYPTAGWMSRGQPAPPGRRTIGERGHRPQSLRLWGPQIALSRSAEVISPVGSPGQTGDTVQAAETPPHHHPPFNASGE